MKLFRLVNFCLESHETFAIVNQLIFYTLQIAGLYGESSYNAFAVPCKPFSPAATLITGMTLKGGQLYQNNNLIQTVSAKTMIENFINFLVQIKTAKTSTETCHIILIGHNALR